MSAKNKKFERGSVTSGSSENLSAKRLGSAKVNRPSSADGSKYSARSTASLDSDVSDFLSVTGTSKVPQKSGQHKRSGSAGFVRSRHNEVHVSGSDSDSTRTSSSSGTRRKTANTKKTATTRFSEDHIPLIMSQAKARAKPKLATTFQRHTNAAKASPGALPDRPSASSQNNLQPDEVDEWWLSVADPTPVPPLFLQSPTELNKENDWWPGLNKTSNHVGEDFLLGDVSNARPVTNNFDQSDPDFDMLEGNSRIKPDKSTTRREDIPKLFLDDLLEDEGDSRRKKAAVSIQRWFRGWKTRKQLSGQNAVKELLIQKKMEKEKEMFGDHTSMQTEEELKDQKEDEKRKRREEKARLARQAAIQELQKKREEKRHENQRKAEEELVQFCCFACLGKQKSLFTCF